MSNPLLDTSSLPRFDEIRPEHVLPAIRQVIADQRSELERLLHAGATPGIDSLVAPVEHMGHELGRIWSPVSHLQSVLGSTDWREAYKEALPLLTEFGTELSQNTDLQRAYAEVERSLPEDASAESRRAIENALRDFHLAGVDLEKEAKDRFKAIMQELAEAQASFEHNVQDASDAWSLNITAEENLRGLPRALLDRAAEDARNAGLDGWLFSLNFPTYDAVMRQADSRDVREALYRAWVTRGSDQVHDPKWDNSEIIERILALRHEAANLVGFGNYSEYSLATKMADTPEQVIGFLRELSAHSREAAERELAELTEFAGMPLAAWDVTYWLEKYKQEKFSVSIEALRAYFPAGTVKEGLFALASQLYGVELHADDSITAWHDDVRYYDVSQDGVVLGSFYTDLFARNGKRTGAWIDECVTRESLNGHSALPVGYLVCNFPPPNDKGVSLLTHDDVVTLFHEFGHMLHHLLTRVGFPSVSGINGVPWDAVELPSQFMENFAWLYS